MRLFVNGETRELAATTLAELLSQLDFEGDWLATAVNNELVRAGERRRYQLSEGDRIEILSPMQGG